MDLVNKIEIDEKKIITRKMNCPLCNSKKSKLYLQTDNLRRGTKNIYNIVECSHCNLRYVKNIPTPKSMKFYYPDNYYSLVSEKINLFERIYYELFRRIPYNSKGKILDIGCGNGKFMYFIKEKGYDVDGHDVFLVPDYVKKDFNIYEGELYNAGIKNDIYDVITMWWSIEHMRNPLRILQECYRILKIGGHIIIATSNINSLEAAIFKKYWHHLLVPEHCIQFTDKTLSEMIKKAGFSDIKVRYDLFSFGFLSSLCLYLKGKNIKVNSAGILVRAFSFLFLPLDILFSLLKRSALITVYAKKKFTY